MFPFAANGRALTLEAGEDAGFVRVVRAATTAASSASRRSAGISPNWPANSPTRSKWARVLEDVAGTIHAHPTLGEAFGEAALYGLGHALHI